MPKPNNAAGVTAGAASGAETLEVGESGLNEKLAKLFPEEGPEVAEGETEGDESQDEGKAKPAGRKPAGETDDLSQAGEETPEQIAEREESELAQRAEAAGVAVDEQRESETAEQERLEAKAEAEGKTVEDIVAEETAAAGADPERKFKKRVGKLLDKIEQLQAQLEEANAAGGTRAETKPSEVENVFSAEKLVALQERSEQGLEEVDGLLTTLGVAPNRVEKQLRAMAAANAQIAEQFKGEDGQEDFSPERMAEVLTGAKRNFQTTLKQIPKRQKFLEARGKTSLLLRQPEIVKVAPFLSDPESEEHEEFKALYRNSPELRNHPNGEYLAAALTLGLKQLNPAVQRLVTRNQARRNGGVAPAAARPAAEETQRRTRMPGTGRPSGAGGTKTKVAAARERFAKSGKLEDLDKVAAEMGM